jgi:hypothetical protein
MCSHGLESLMGITNSSWNLEHRQLSRMVLVNLSNTKDNRLRSELYKAQVKEASEIVVHMSQGSPLRHDGV